MGSERALIHKSLSRREATRLFGGAWLTAALPSGTASAWAQQTQQTPQGRQPDLSSDELTLEDEAFLEEMQQRGCLFFAEQVGGATGQVLDRALNHSSTGERDPRVVASIAATGFGLTALCIAHRQGYLPSDQVQQQVRTTLDFHLNHLPHEHGFFYHFNHIDTGRPMSWSEVSGMDTALLLCGVLTCRAYFNDSRIKDLATQIYERVDWPWMLNGGNAFAYGWFPSTGFIPGRWDHYAEFMCMVLLAIGSPTHPVPPSVWDGFARPRIRYRNFEYISGRDPLFVHQFSHAWFDFANQRDRYANYYQNSVEATRAHKSFLLTLKRGYSDDYWGVSASDWQHGYTAWGGPPLMGPVDGSVVPCAAAGSLPFLPRECVRTLRFLRDRYGRDAWARYGFCDAFHPEQLWYDPDVLGIDIGIGVLMAENLRSGFVWETFMRNPEPAHAMELCGFHQLSPEEEEAAAVAKQPSKPPARPRARRRTAPTTP